MAYLSIASPAAMIVCTTDTQFQVRPDSDSVFGDAADECMLMQTGDFQLVRAITECTWYIDTVNDGKSWCFESKFTGVISDPFRQKAHADAAPIVKFIKELCPPPLNASSTLMSPE